MRIQQIWVIKNENKILNFWKKVHNFRGIFRSVATDTASYTPTTNSTIHMLPLYIDYQPLKNANIYNIFENWTVALTYIEKRMCIF